MSSVKERLALFLVHKKLSQKEFAKMVGVSKGFAANIRVSIQPKTLDKISAVFPDLNTGWLLTGQGSMLVDKEVVKQNIEATDHSVANAYGEVNVGDPKAVAELLRAKDELLRAKDQIIEMQKAEIARLKAADKQ
ncbi:MAG: helix-turn-helix domain-containing protein [Bacteroidales bacterium]|nr:helix-turn-helix domain-containing protein [Bacteroidales bacterium]